MTFDLIIPCHNSGETIGRCLESLTRQGIEKNELHVIIVDDASTKPYTDIVDGYRNRLRIDVYRTETDIHCPGNTRREGMKHIGGDWLCFCDHDDFYEDDALRRVGDFIERTGERYCVCTVLQSWNEKTDNYIPLARKQAWLHGKFYSIPNLIKPYGIDFKKNLMTHEDIYFNSTVLNILYGMERDFCYYDINTYRWVENPKSITRSYNGDRGYLYEHFNDYLVAAAEPFFEKAKTGADIFVNQVLMTLLHAYFYYEAASYMCGPWEYKDCIGTIRAYMRKLRTELNVTLDDIVNYVYDDAVKYAMVREESRIASGDFIEKTSFRDFVYRNGADV